MAATLAIDCGICPYGLNWSAKYAAQGEWLRPFSFRDSWSHVASSLWDESWNISALWATPVKSGIAVTERPVLKSMADDFSEAVLRGGELMKHRRRHAYLLVPLGRVESLNASVWTVPNGLLSAISTVDQVS